MASQNDVFIIPDVASLLKMTEKTVYSLLRKGNLPAFKAGVKWRFRQTAIDSCIKVKTNAAGAQLANNGVKPLRFRWED